MSFPKDFIWGAATSSYQIEGATSGVDGCGESVWDLSCRKNGFAKGGDNGFTACDHYHRYREDVGLMKEIGLTAYRLSIMWPRVLPEGVGRVNQAGLDYYDRLIDTLCAAGIAPWVTLFHWDYPVELFYRGGWLNGDSPRWFEDYVRVVVDRLSDRVRHWLTLNEPACFIGHGHRMGVHAPGIQLPDALVMRAWHHALLAHGRAVRVIRGCSRSPAPMVGSAPCFHTYIPASGRPEDVEAARRMMFEARGRELFHAPLSLDPCYRSRYPEDVLAQWGADGPPIRDGDMELIGQDLDFIGINIYGSGIVRAGEKGEPEVVWSNSNHPHTVFNWPVTPDGVRWATKFLYEAYGKPVVVTENGMAGLDWVSVDGQVHDPQRVDFLTRHLRSLKTSIDEGVNVMGYFHWSLMDNFEWAEGYRMRFGLIHVDFETQRRIIKDSGHFYRRVIESGGQTIDPGDAGAPCGEPQEVQK